MRKTTFFSILFSLCLILTACGTSNSSSTTSDGRTKVILTQSSSSLLFAPIYIAQGKGFFKEEGLDVEISIAGGSTNVLSSVIGGSADVGATGLSVVMDANKKGQDVQAFASLINQYASNIVIKKDIAAKLGITNDSPIEDKINALKGLSIGVTAPGGGSDRLIRYLLKSQNLNPDKDTTIVPLGKAEAVVPAFINNQIQAFSFSSPTSEQGANSENGMLLINLSKGEVKDLDGFSHSTLLASKKYIDENPETVQKLTNAIAKAEKYIAENKEEAKKELKKSFDKLDDKIFDASFENNYDAFARNPTITETGYKMNVEFEEIDVPFEKVVNNTFAENSIK